MEKTKNQTRVLVVDDSAFMRKIISDMINTDPDVEVIGIAKNGEQALEQIKYLNPDVVTLDIEMPVLNGIQTLKKIKGLESPPSVIMLSSFTQQGSEKTLKALELGAIDFISKPSGPISLDIQKVQEELLAKIKAAANVRVSMYQAKQLAKEPGKNQELETADFQLEPMSTRRKYKDTVLVIGCSTGGPRALNEIIPKIPKEFPGCVLIVQHMPAGFTQLLGERLNSISPMTVKEAQHGEPLIKGRVYIAPGNFHLSVSRRSRSGSGGLNNWQAKVSDDPPVKGLRPCADILFKSVSKMEEVNLFGVILTGMGNDGSEGVKHLKGAGGYIVVEDESTCVVYGMPRAAFNTGMVDKKLPLTQIIPEVLKVVG